MRPGDGVAGILIRQPADPSHVPSESDLVRIDDLLVQHGILNELPRSWQESQEEMVDAVKRWARGLRMIADEVFA